MLTVANKYNTYYSVYLKASRFGYLVGLLSILVVLGFTGCSQQPAIDTELFRQTDYTSNKLEKFLDIDIVMNNIQSIANAGERVDSLLAVADRLKGYDVATALFYAEEAYQQATKENWDLQRAISLYYIALMKRRLQAWGGGIEDALPDAEFSAQLFKRLGRKDWLIRAYDLIGIIHFRQFDRGRPLKLDTARNYFLLGLETLESANLNVEDSIGLSAEILYDLGTTYERADPEKANQYFQQSFAGFSLIDDQISLSRLMLSIGSLWDKEGKPGADSLYKICENVAQSYNDNELLSWVYLNQSINLLASYKKTKDDKTLYRIVQILNNRLRIQKEGKYHSYERLGITFKSKAAILYKKSETYSNPDSIKFYVNQSYQFVDTVLNYYKIAIEEARKKGALTVMDNLTKNILKTCVNRFIDGQGEWQCSDILGDNISRYISSSYNLVTEQLTANLTNANQRIRKMEREESEKIGARKRKELLISGIVIISLAILLFIVFLQRAEQRKLRARMEALRAQINPHFLSNSLNAIENLVNLGENAAASKYLIKFSRLSRRILNSSRDLDISLSDELKTLEHFLALEELRFKDKFSYEIRVAAGLQPELIEVPAMILQPYIENAIWHGIKPKIGPGRIKIFIERSNKLLVCTIEDNGIGREKSRQMKSNSVLKQKSHGMKINEERLKSTGKIRKARVEIVDLRDDNGISTGTRVVLRLPFKLIGKKKMEENVNLRL